MCYCYYAADGKCKSKEVGAEVAVEAAKVAVSPDGEREKRSRESRGGEGEEWKKKSVD